MLATYSYPAAIHLKPGFPNLTDARQQTIFILEMLSDSLRTCTYIMLMSTCCVWPCAEVDHASEVSMGTASRRCQSAERVQIQRHGLRVNNPNWKINKCKQSHRQHAANAISHDVFTLGFSRK